MVKFKVKLKRKYKAGKYEFSKVKYGEASAKFKKLFPGKYDFNYDPVTKTYKINTPEGIYPKSDERITEAHITKTIKEGFWILVD